MTRAFEIIYPPLVPPRTRPCLDLTAERLEQCLSQKRSDGLPFYHDARDAVISWSLLLKNYDRLTVGKVRIV